MIYLVYGNQNILVDRKIQELLEQKKEREIIRIDAAEEKKFHMSELLEACQSTSLFAPENIILVRNPYFLNNKADDGDIKQLAAYLENPLYESDLIFYVYGPINQKLKITKDLMSNARVFAYKDLNHRDYLTYANQLIQDSALQLKKQDKDYLLNSADDNLDILFKNIEILELYPDVPDSSIIRQLVSSSVNNDVFTLINAMCRKDISSSYRYFQELIATGSNIIGIISMMANQLHYLYNVAYYLTNGYSDEEIMSLTSTKSPYRLKMAKESLVYYTKNAIIRLLASLADFDYQLKSNTLIDPKQRFELFIMTLKEI